MPEPPYVAVIFTSLRSDEHEGYEEMNDLTYTAVEDIDGYLGYENYRNQDGFGVNVSFWRDMEAARKWKEHALHLKAQQLGREKWYRYYRIRVCTVERDYEFTSEETEGPKQRVK